MPTNPPATPSQDSTINGLVTLSTTAAASLGNQISLVGSSITKFQDVANLFTLRYNYWDYYIASYELERRYLDGNYLEFPISNYRYKFSTAITNTPAAGVINFNNATYSAVTNIYVNVVDSGLLSLPDLIAGSPSSGPLILANSPITFLDNNNNVVSFLASGVPTLIGSVYTIPVSYSSVTGNPFTNLAAVFSLSFNADYINFLNALGRLYTSPLTSVTEITEFTGTPTAPDVFLVDPNNELNAAIPGELAQRNLLLNGFVSNPMPVPIQTITSLSPGGLTVDVEAFDQSQQVIPTGGQVLIQGPSSACVATINTSTEHQVGLGPDFTYYYTLGITLQTPTFPLINSGATVMGSASGFTNSERTTEIAATSALQYVFNNWIALYVAAVTFWQSVMTLQANAIANETEENMPDTVYIAQQAAALATLTTWLTTKLVSDSGLAPIIAIATSRPPQISNRIAYIPNRIGTINNAKASIMVETNTVTFNAVMPGLIGNSIALVFNGTATVTTVVNAWNLANPSNQVSFVGTGSLVPTTQMVNLSGANTGYGYRYSYAELLYDLASGQLAQVNSLKAQQVQLATQQTASTARASSLSQQL
jgi:hypothetical protein